MRQKDVGRAWRDAFAQYGAASHIFRSFRAQAEAAGVVRCALHVVAPFHSFAESSGNPFWWGFSDERKSFYAAYRAEHPDQLAELIMERGEVVLLRDAMDWLPKTELIAKLRAEALTHHDDDGVCIPMFGPFGHRTLLIISFGEQLVDTRDPRIEPIRQLALAGQRAVVLSKRSEQLPDRALSPREIAVLRGVGRGASNKEIARLLGISTHSVDADLRRIYAKLDATTRLQASFRAMELGLFRL